MLAVEPTPVIRPVDIGKVAAYSPSFHANGRSMFFHAGREGTTSLLQASLGNNGSLVAVKTILRDGASNYHIEVSPDGSRIAFDSDRDGARGVYVAELDGSRARRISGSGYAAIPRWSPDGATLGFVRAEVSQPKVWNLWTVKLATRETQRHTSHSVGQLWGASWFPDSRRVAYSH